MVFGKPCGLKSWNFVDHPKVVFSLRILVPEKMCSIEVLPKSLKTLLQQQTLAWKHVDRKATSTYVRTHTTFDCHFQLLFAVNNPPKRVGPGLV